MDAKHNAGRITRREMLFGAAALAGTAAFTGYLTDGLLAGAAPQGGPAGTVAALVARRAALGANPIVPTKLGDNLTMLSGAGGNVVVLNGPDGKIVLDTFVQPAWPKLKQFLDEQGNTPIKLLINSHWHFDHTDNNGPFRQAGAPILAHVNSKKRMMETHDLLGMHFVPRPSNELPTETFQTTRTITANSESIQLTHVAPAHTDSDIFIHYPKANVLHMADVFFNGAYPFIDVGTAGNINGMIAGANKGLGMVDNSTKVVPGHGPLGDKAALMKYRDVITTIRDRVQKQKAAGKKLEEVLASKPSAEFDATWGKGLMMPDQFVTIVYNTLWSWA